MSYTDAQLQAFWFGGTEDAPGDENNFLPGNYVTMKLAAYLLTTPGSLEYDADFAAKLLYCRQNKLFGFANTSQNGWSGPTKS